MIEKKNSFLRWCIILQLLFMLDVGGLFLFPYHIFHGARIGYAIALVCSGSLPIIIFALWQTVAIAFLAANTGMYELIMGIFIAWGAWGMVPRFLVNFRVQYFLALFFLLCMVYGGALLSGVLLVTTLSQALLQVSANTLILYSTMCFVIRYVR